MDFHVKYVRINFVGQQVVKWPFQDSITFSRSSTLQFFFFLVRNHVKWYQKFIQIYKGYTPENNLQTITYKLFYIGFS